MKRGALFATLILAAVVFLAAALWVRSRFERDLALAAERAVQGSALVHTDCGPVEMQQAGDGIPLLMIHGCGGGHDQGMA